MVKLVEGTIAQLKVPAGKRDIIIFDDALPGFGVRKFASGKASYFVKYAVGGQQRKTRSGHKDQRRPSVARPKAYSSVAIARLAEELCHPHGRT